MLATEGAILDALDEATAAALVAEVPGDPEHYSFSHALIRTTLYEELSSARRARLHRRVGEALEALAGATPGTRIDELAHHWLAAAQVADATKAIGYARQAGDCALAGLAYEAAASHYERALAVLEPTDRDGEVLRCDLLLALGEAQRSAGDARFRETMAAAAALARRHGDAHRLGVAALGSGLPAGAVLGTTVDDTLVALYTEASAALGTSHSVLRSRLLGQLAVELVLSADRDRRHALSAEALDIARRAGDRVELAHALIARVYAISDPTTLTKQLALTEELVALATDLGSLELNSWAAFHRARTLLESGDAIGAARALARFEQLAAQLRVPLLNFMARLARAMWALMYGSPDAEELALAAGELGSSIGHPGAGPALFAQLGEIRYRQGRCAEMVDALRAHVESMPHILGLRAGLAHFYCESNLLDKAKEQFALVAANGFDLPLDRSWAGAMFHLAEVCGALRDPNAAEVLYPKLRPLAKQVGMLANTLRCDGSLGHAAGVLAACLCRWEDDRAALRACRSK